ncbi:glycosyltransferase family 4 protein [Antribacter gilvus]|uniref:glycosyltransferase family 4 protein n=1 Tax=Antribacter gilvus TaxID=2304675 RepID=UPI000F790CD6|nr:glycosyltransferase family 1 protein [Antribacter gilvus]
MQPPLSVALTVEQLWQPVPGGSGTYIRELAGALLDRGDVEPYGVRARPAPAPGGTEAPLGPPGLPVVTSRLPRAALYESWSRLRRPAVPGPPGAGDGTPGRSPAVVHATTWAVPPRSAPLVVTVHDLAFRRSPEHFTRRGVAFFERALELTRREADVVVVPSEATRADAVAEGIGADRVQVVPHGVRADAGARGRVPELRERFRLERDYVLWCGAIEPRKNLGVLLDAYARLLDEGSELDLVLVGPDGWGGAPSALTERLSALPPGRVHRTGQVSAADLQAAYAGATVFCFPSLWEGFGMPVLEAQAHGVPVVTTAETSMAEVSGDGAVLVPAQDARAVADGIAHALSHHEKLSAAALTNAAGYTWARSAELHLDAYRDAAGTAPAGAVSHL